jgi:hypothetical protein
MTTKHLQQLLQDLEDTRELVFGRDFRDEDGLRLAWRLAHDEAARAFRAWCEFGGRAAYSVYLAAEDRADAAVAALASSR